ncbi:hypothetical protein C8Q72DRAFT_830675 [Fomitopsis betulina]|nr:hypothetical protein C8Q72DRAFT_830675 [Fomitopsis betulina]
MIRKMGRKRTSDDNEQEQEPARKRPGGQAIQQAESSTRAGPLGTQPTAIRSHSGAISLALPPGLHHASPPIPPPASPAPTQPPTTYTREDRRSPRVPPLFVFGNVNNPPTTFAFEAPVFNTTPSHTSMLPPSTVMPPEHDSGIQTVPSMHNALSGPAAAMGDQFHQSYDSFTSMPVVDQTAAFGSSHAGWAPAHAHRAPDEDLLGFIATEEAEPLVMGSYEYDFSSDHGSGPTPSSYETGSDYLTSEYGLVPNHQLGLSGARLDWAEDPLFYPPTVPTPEYNNIARPKAPLSRRLEQAQAPAVQHSGMPESKLRQQQVAYNAASSAPPAVFAYSATHAGPTSGVVWAPIPTPITQDLALLAADIDWLEANARPGGYEYPSDQPASTLSSYETGPEPLVGYNSHFYTSLEAPENSTMGDHDSGSIPSDQSLGSTPSSYDAWSDSPPWYDPALNHQLGMVDLLNWEEGTGSSSHQPISRAGHDVFHPIAHELDSLQAEEPAVQLSGMPELDLWEQQVGTLPTLDLQDWSDRRIDWVSPYLK